MGNVVFPHLTRELWGSVVHWLIASRVWRNSGTTNNFSSLTQFGFTGVLVTLNSEKVDKHDCPTSRPSEYQSRGSHSILLVQSISMLIWWCTEVCLNPDLDDASQTSPLPRQLQHVGILSESFHSVLSISNILMVQCVIVGLINDFYVSKSLTNCLYRYE